MEGNRLNGFHCECRCYVTGLKPSVNENGVLVFSTELSYGAESGMVIVDVDE